MSGDSSAVAAPQAKPENAPSCDGCDRPLNPVEALHWSVCFDCTKARQRALLARRCVCGRKRVPGQRCRAGSRVWIPCRRCLGQIRQIA